MNGILNFSLISIIVMSLISGNPAFGEECYREPSLPRPGIIVANAHIYALLIGVDDCNFPEKRFRKLKYPERDLKRVSRAYKKQGYTVISLSGDSVRLASIRCWFSYLKKQLKNRPEDRIVFHFCGHGMQIQNDYAMVLYQQKDDKVMELLYWSEVESWIRETGTTECAVIIDGCFSGDTALSTIPQPPVFHPQLGSSTVFNLTTWNLQVAEGIFTPLFLDAFKGEADGILKNGETGLISGREIEEYISANIMKEKYLKKDSTNYLKPYSARVFVEGDEDFNFANWQR